MKLKNLIIVSIILSALGFLILKSSAPSRIEETNNFASTTVEPSPTPIVEYFEYSVPQNEKIKTLHITDNTSTKPTSFNLSFPQYIKIQEEKEKTTLYLLEDSKEYFYLWSDIKEFDERMSGLIKLPNTTIYSLITKTDSSKYEHSYYSETYLHNGWYYYKHTIVYNNVPYYFSVKIREDKIDESKPVMNAILANMTPSTITKEGYDSLMQYLQQ